MDGTNVLFPGRIDGEVGESIPEENLDYAVDTDDGSELDSESSDLDADDDFDGDAAIYKADGLLNDRMSRQMQRHADKTARLEQVSCAAAACFVCGYNWYIIL